MIKTYWHNGDPVLSSLVASPPKFYLQRFSSTLDWFLEIDPLQQLS